MERIFLGWESGLLERVADWLVATFDEDMDDVVVALPGARAGRILQELTARRIGPAWRPPRILTVGVLSDALLQVEGAAASRMVRTLAWEQALRRLPAETLGRLVARPPAREDRRAWSALAEEVRGLFGEVAAEATDFEAVASSALLEHLPGEVQRWRALGKAQGIVQEQLRSLDLHDPHLGRLEAIEAGRVHRPRHVVLVGAVEMNALLRRTLDACEAPQTALVLAPETESDRFDARGCLIPERWAERDVALELGQWHVVDRPADQARVATSVLAREGGAYRAEQISIGVLDPEVAPFLRSRLAESGIRARDAAGTPIARTPAVRLLAAVSDFLRSRSYQDFAALVRHPDFERALRAADRELEPLEVLDAYHARHLPWRADGNWSAESGDARDQHLRRRMNELWQAARRVLGPLLEPGAGAVGEHVEGLRALLESVFGGADPEAGPEAARVDEFSLRCLGREMRDLESLPAELAPRGSAAETLDLLVRAASNPANLVPAPAASPGEATIELLGWFELPLDDAPVLVVTGFQEGRVPESVRGDAFLPNRLRQSLGIVDNEARLARDLYATELLVHSRERVAFVSGRRNVAGDPLLPSRVAFQRPESEVVARVRHFLPGDTRRAPASEARGSGGSRSLPRGAEVPELEVLSVSAFKTFLEAPYAYYLRHALRLETCDDRAREMDGAGFGNLAHAVLQRFGEDESARESKDREAIEEFLLDHLETLGAETFGARPMPAVRIQLDQLAYRLRVFAGAQAERRRAGWRIHAVEWAPEGGAIPFPVDGQTVLIRGRIDRIDRHEQNGSFAIWDYKTGENAKGPLASHRKKDGTWTDLQLPLYTLLVAELLGDAQPAEMGYVTIGRDPKRIGFQSVPDWRRSKGECDDSDEALATAFEVAKEVVRRIRKGELFEVENWKPRDEVFAAIAGAGLVGVDAEEAE